MNSIQTQINQSSFTLSHKTLSPPILTINVPFNVALPFTRTTPKVKMIKYQNKTKPCSPFAPITNETIPLSIITRLEREMSFEITNNVEIKIDLEVEMEAMIDCDDGFELDCVCATDEVIDGEG